jgi:hypothetical protein
MVRASTGPISGQDLTISRRARRPFVWLALL